jgi:hypothetical protein
MNRSLEALGQDLTLQLPRAELRLHVNQDPFDLDMDDLIRSRHDEVGGSRVAVSDGDFELDAPHRVSHCHDGLSQGELP